jgi:hypothetical protein
MGKGSVRSGTSTVPTTIASGTDGSPVLPRIVEFTEYARPCVVYNNTGNNNVIRVKVNATDDTDFSGASTDGIGHFPILDGTATDVSMGGILDVHRISFVTIAGGDDLDDVEVHGWLP